MVREIKNTEFNSNNDRNEGMADRERLEGFAASEMADRGPKGMSSFTGEEDGTETRPVTQMYAEPGGTGAVDDDDDDLEDDDDMDDDLDIDEDIEVDDDDDIEIDDTVTDEDLDDDLTLVDDEDEDEDDL